MASDPTFAVGDVVRVRNMRGLYRIKRLHIVRGEVDLWGGVYGRSMMRTVTVDRLMPARPGDVAPERVPEMAAPSKRRAR